MSACYGGSNFARGADSLFIESGDFLTGLEKVRRLGLSEGKWWYWS